MGKAKKEHRKRVQARNQRIKQAQKAFKNKFQEELLKQIELEKQKRDENQSLTIEEQTEEENNKS